MINVRVFVVPAFAGIVLITIFSWNRVIYTASNLITVLIQIFDYYSLKRVFFFLKKNLNQDSIYISSMLFQCDSVIIAIIKL